MQGLYDRRMKLMRKFRIDCIFPFNRFVMDDIVRKRGSVRNFSSTSCIAGRFIIFFLRPLLQSHPKSSLNVYSAELNG